MCRGLFDQRGYFVQDGRLYACADDRTEVNIHEEDGMTGIGSGAFAGNERYVRISLPASIESVGEGAFTGCTGLRELEILSSMAFLTDEIPFENCSSLVSAAVCGMAACDFPDEKERDAAAIGFCRRSEYFDREKSRSYIEYISGNIQRIAKEIVDDQLTDAMSYLTGNGLIPADRFAEVLEYAQKEKKMEIVAILLEYRNSWVGDDILEKYSI